MGVLAAALVSLSGCALLEGHFGAVEHVSMNTVTDLNVDSPVSFDMPRPIYASLRTDVPADFTGCIEGTEECYVVGEAVESRLRFEPQTGRFWFLDPGSGNTYFENGELRTGSPARVRPVLVPREGVYPEGDVTLDVDEDEDTSS